IGIAFDASNYLYVADQYNHPSVIKYAPDSSPSTFVNGLSEPVDVNIDSAGNVYVLDAVREIYEYSPSGILLNSFVVNGGSVANAFVIQPTTIVPSLSIVSSGNNIALSWPTNAAKYVLQQSFDVTTKEWTNISIEPTVTNSQNQIVLTPTNSQSFFRLSSQ
ncbi:MAG TPA: hypothetical protein VN048_06420, partial [Verrucomicrobiae bacterium]|nr:hypothetical protein [Verrucomicrobiae bacterium]